MGKTVPDYVPLRPIKGTSHADSSDSDPSVSSLHFPPRPPLLPPPNNNEEFANVHGSLVPLIHQITTHTAKRAGKDFNYITFPSPPFQHLGFDDVRSHSHMRIMAKILLFTDHGEPCLATAKRFLAEISANRRDIMWSPTRFYNSQGKQYLVQFKFIPRQCEIRFSRIPIIDAETRSLEDQEEAKRLERWTDVVRFYVSDSATFGRRRYWDRTAPDAIGDTEGPWTKEEMKKREGPCWRHGKRGVPDMGPFDDGDNIDWRQSG